MCRPDSLLPPNALQTTTIGISVSESVDLNRLGLLENHFRLALGEIARCILVSGGKIAYGGHLQPEGYTTFLMKEVSRYGRADFPLSIFLAWQEHQAMSLRELNQKAEELGLYGKFHYLDENGTILSIDQLSNEQPNRDIHADIKIQSLTALRKVMCQETTGRVLLGGKRANFQGNYPGLLEEALLSLEASQPLYLAGGFGGVTLDIAQTLGIDDGSWFPRREESRDPRLEAGIELLSKFKKDTIELNNGLSKEENRKLAVTHRPSEIATLVSLGLGRIRGTK